MSTKMKLAVLGLNHGYKFAQDSKQIAGVELVAVAGNDKLAKQRAELLGAPLFVDYRDLLETCELDGVIITLPNHLHEEAVRLCAEKGIHVLVEKPIAATVTDGEAMIRVARKHGIHLLVGHHRRFSSKVRKLKETLASGVIGNLVGINMMFTLAKDHAYFAENWRITKGGGPLLINAVHDIDTIRFMTGLTIERVYASSQNLIRKNEVEDTASILMETAEGPTINYFVSDGVPAPWSYELTTGENPKYARAKGDCYYFFGTKGSIAFPSFTVYTYDENQYGWDHPLQLKKMNVQDNDPMTAELLHFIDIVKSGVSPFVTGADALETLKVILAIKRSAEERRIVEI